MQDRLHYKEMQVQEATTRMWTWMPLSKLPEHANSLAQSESG